jgi:hypothetical protein
VSGICVDALNPAGCPSAEALIAAGADGARLVAFDEPRFFEYATALLDASLTVSVVIARESCADDDFGGWASFYSSRIAPTYWVLGNEADAYLLAPAESPSSWSMTPPEYAAFWHAAAPPILANYPGAKLVVGGLVSGQPSYLDELLPLLNPPPYAIDIHPYGRDAASADDLFSLYRSVALPDARARFGAYAQLLGARGFTRRLFCLEFNQPADQIAAYEQMLAEETGCAAWFCWSDGMVAPFGLIDAAGNEKPEYAAFCAATGGTMTAIEERAAQIGPEMLGEPLGDEIELGPIKLRPYYNATLVEIPGAGVYALSEATVADRFLPSPP